MAKNEIEFVVLYTNSQQDIQKILNDRNFDNVKKFEDEVYKEFQALGVTSDDFWIEDIWVDKGELTKVSIDWKEMLTGRNGTRLDQDSVDIVFEAEEEFIIKAQFLINEGKDFDIIEDVIVYEYGNERLIEGNYEARYPENWLMDEVENNGWGNSVMEQYYSYFEEGYARMMSDDQINGKLTAGYIGNEYFVYFWGN